MKYFIDDMIGWGIDRVFCSGCLSLRFGPGHLSKKFLLGIDCDHVW
jgi:hypothetical protein